MIPPLPSSPSLNLPPTALLSTVHKSLSNFSIVGAFLDISVASYNIKSSELLFSIPFLSIHVDPHSQATTPYRQQAYYQSSPVPAFKVVEAEG